MSTATGPISAPPPPQTRQVSNEVSNTRLYLGNLPPNVTKADIEAHFGKHGTGEIVEIKLMTGFGFIEYKDPMDARDIVPAFHGSPFMGERLTVQFARGRNPREPPPFASHQERAPPRPRRTAFRMTVSGLPSDTSWQDLKDFARRTGLDVVFSETNRSGEGSIEFETAQDLAVAIEKLNNTDFQGRTVTCTAAPPPQPYSDIVSRDGRGRSRSPMGRRPYLPRDDYDRRGPPPPRGYSPRREPAYRGGYRDRSPRREYYDDRMRYPPSPPRRGPPMDDYPPPPRRYDDPYRRDYPPADPYASNRAPYDRVPPPPQAPRDFPHREPVYARDAGYPRDYDRRYW